MEKESRIRLDCTCTTSFLSCTGPKIAAAFQVPANVFTWPHPRHAPRSIGQFLPLAALQPIGKRYANKAAVRASFGAGVQGAHGGARCKGGKTKAPITAWNREWSEWDSQVQQCMEKTTLYIAGMTPSWVNESHKSGNSFHWEEREFLQELNLELNDLLVSKMNML